MGASGWDCWTAYLDDPSAALAAARQEVFEAGDFYRFDDTAFETLEELVEYNDEEGTHSVIDIDSVSDDPSPDGVASPVTASDLQRIFGTLTPTREQIEEHDRDLHSIVEGRSGWTASYVTAFKDGRPDEIYFFGISGD